MSPLTGMQSERSAPNWPSFLSPSQLLPYLNECGCISTRSHIRVQDTQKRKHTSEWKSRVDLVTNSDTYVTAETHAA